MDILAIHNSPGTIAVRTAAIHAAMLRECAGVRRPNFERIGVADLARLVELYDRHFFEGWLALAVQSKAGIPLALRLSRTMTRAGGKTIRHRTRPRGGVVRVRYEIAIASRMLFMTFAGVQRPVVVCGLTCQDRLEALQRIVEHEIVHLIELLLWDRSSCRGKRFKQLATDLFGHTGTTHALVTPPEHAAEQHGVYLGATVKFQHAGRQLTGRVNRIHQRATILVADARGRRYTDGGTYEKFYVPLNMLTPLPGKDAGAKP